ncbi:Fis family transcriptional regulator [Alkalilimnicola ehrlichii]|uniref:Putative Fis-like DNA-binding protein n=1 Tax=Alkalilimnicola ehrlichii TaxID=351052 RepID=A0A3E0X402_9GAMM|nr:DNA-binding transcriptional regulator Fis [Alkalilimnicola ehrlichii]RFA31453.1 Fis family transcriptional regulator [Alkalilimnicola ehrlichii]RFA39276.1 Fis family transcriptional regulator [Alkalilimnicola ehrlichii]
MEEQATTREVSSPVRLDSQSNAAVGPIRACVSDALATYFEQLNGHDCEGLYRLVLAEVEIPMLEAVMQYCGGNQTKAAQVLGINRGTLRKKLQQYDLDD